MGFYTQKHQFYCGIDLHARQMYLCILDSDGKIQLHRNMPATAEQLERTLARFVDSDIAIAVECVFTRQGYAAGTGSPTSVPNATFRSSSVTPCT